MSTQGALAVAVTDPPVRAGATVVLPGQTPAGEHILSVLLKRTYHIIADAKCRRAETDPALLAGDVPWGNPLNSTTRFESDFVPFKVATDVVFEGWAYAPPGAVAVDVGITVADRQKRLRVTGDRRARFGRDGTISFTEPAPFETMELRYERAYGGIDVYSDKTMGYPYPRNPLGLGFVVANTEASVENRALPNIEDPDDLLTPERLCAHDYAKWPQQPMPAGLGWFPKTAYPRALFAGILPADRAFEQQMRAAYAQLVPADQRAAYLSNSLPDMDFRFFSGASAGLAMDFLQGDELIELHNLSAEGVVRFWLPGERPRIGLDIGGGVKAPKIVVHTVMIRMPQREVDIVWRGAVPYPGRDWLPQMRKMAVVVD